MTFSGSGIHVSVAACALVISFIPAAPAADQPSRKITPPKEALGFDIGDDYYLATYTN